MDPLSLPINAWMGRILALSGQLDQAIEHLRKTMDMDPNFVLSRYRLGQVYEDKGMYDQAIEEFMQLGKLSGGKLLATIGLAHASASAGKREEAEGYLDALLKLSKQGFGSPSQIAVIYIALGDNDKAFAWLDEADKIRDLNVVRVKHDPRFAPLRSDPRFDALVRRIGIP
ncbi:MAG: tetratricopeptide repeat protein [Pyrinomonadaceae bacterium]